MRSRPTTRPAKTAGHLRYPPPALQMAFPTPYPLNPTPSQINRHTFLLEIAVSHTKQRPGQILLETKTAFSPHPFHRSKTLSRRLHPTSNSVNLIATTESPVTVGTHSRSVLI